MWFPDKGVPLERAHQMIQQSLWTLAGSKIPSWLSRDAPPLEVQEKGYDPKLRGEYFRRVHYDTIALSWRIIREMVRSKPNQLLFAVNADGRKVGISDECLPKFLLKRHGNVSRAQEEDEGIDFEERFRLGANIRSAYQFDWFRYSATVGIFEEEEFDGRFPRGKHPTISRGAVYLSEMRKELVYQNALKSATAFAPRPTSVSREIASGIAMISQLEDRLKSYEAIEGWRVVLDGDIDPLNYLHEESESRNLWSGRFEDVEDEDPVKPRGRKPSIPHIAQRAIQAEFMRRLDSGEIGPGEKRQAVIRLAIEWASSSLGLRIKETATREVLLPILEKIPSK